MGLEIDIAWLTVLLFGSLGLLLALGLPMAFCTGSLATIFLFVFGNPAILNMMPARIFPFMTDYQLSAVPLFIFMAAMLEKAGIIEELFDAVYKWLGAVKGGLAAATVLACTALAAMVGVVGATEVTMGMIALPAMLKRGYDEKLACGSLLAGGTLGILIPPSVMAIVYAVVAQQSLGELLVGSIFPGLLLSGLYVTYILVRCYINPKLGLALPRGASQRPRKIAPSEQYGRADSANHPRARYHIRRYRDSGGGSRNRDLRRVIRLRPAPSPELARHSRSSDCDAEGDGHGDVDFLRRDHVRRLLHSERGAALRFGIHSRYRPAALWHSDADDGDPFCARHVPGLGRHSAADRADFPAHNEEPSVGRPVWYSRSKARGCGTVVWRNLHGQHADGFPIAALRLFPFLSKERGATADQHGYDLPRFRQFYDFAMDRRWTLHHFPSDHLVATEYHLRGTLSDQRGAFRTKSFC